MQQRERTYILASASPRRKQLLSYLNLDKTMQYAVETDESIADEWTPQEAVVQLSMNKGIAVLSNLPERLIGLSDESISIISADTIVVGDEEILGKPVDAADAFNMLKSLQGRSHEVYTGLTLLTSSYTELVQHTSKVIAECETCGANVTMLSRDDKDWHSFGQIGHYRTLPDTGANLSIMTGYIKSKVTFRPLDDAQIHAYVNTGDPLDKAGAYGIQGIGAVNIEAVDGDFYSVMGLPLSLLHHFITLSHR